MKKHAIIPLFIPHLGCPHDCVFCNQKIITAETESISREKILNEVESRLISLRPLNIETLEIAFFGGSFTALPLDFQENLLDAVYPYKKIGDVSKIRLSTRPDYINSTILNLLKKYGVDIIELGAQSFDNEVLMKSERGHTAEQTENSCILIQENGFSLGIQLMIGLPSDTRRKSVQSAKKTIDLKPDFVRIYPTVVLQDTVLATQFQNGTFIPFSRDEMIQTSKEIVLLFNNADIPVIRLGLKSTDFLNSFTDLSKTYHPAFRQLVEGELAMDIIKQQIRAAGVDSGIVVLSANLKSFSNLIGHNGKNKSELKIEYPNICFQFMPDDTLQDRQYLLNVT